jgi:ATP-dependent DNA helicase RecQ
MLVNIKEHVHNLVEDCIGDKSSMIVLKGIDITLFNDQVVVDMDEMLNNKLSYFMKLSEERSMITYDEYIALYDLILLQYKRILILDNNLYLNFYPLQVKISDEKLHSLLIHFDEDKEGDDYEIGDLAELTSIYGNITVVKDRYYVSYNNTIAHEKERKIHLFDGAAGTIEREKIVDADFCMDIIDEHDYVCMLDRIHFEHPAKLYIIEKNTSINKILLEEKLQVIRRVYQDLDLKIGYIEEQKVSTDINPEFTQILKTHWGYETFKKIKVYNMNELNHGSKVVEEITQGPCADNLIQIALAEQ